MDKAKCPVAIWIVAALYMGVGIFTASRMVADLFQHHPYSVESGLAGLVAIVAAAYLRRGDNWARWLALAWIAFHVAISYRVPSEWMAHLGIMAAIGVLLFLPSSRRFFAGQVAA